MVIHRRNRRGQNPAYRPSGNFRAIRISRASALAALKLLAHRRCRQASLEARLLLFPAGSLSDRRVEDWSAQACLAFPHARFVPNYIQLLFVYTSLTTSTLTKHVPGI